MKKSASKKSHPVDIPEAVISRLLGPLDCMKEEICSQLQAEIRWGFADLSVKLIHEIQNLSCQGSVEQFLESKEKIPTMFGNRQNSVLEEAYPKHSSMSSNRNGFATTPEAVQIIPASQNQEELPRQSLDSLSPTGKARHMQPWRNAVLNDIDKHENSVSAYIESVVIDIKSRNLKDEELQDNRLVRFVLGKYFIVFTCSVIAANAIWMGYENDSEVGRQFDNQRTWQDTVSSAFTVWFMAELVLRIAALRKHFIFGNDGAWNLLDFALVVACVPELFIHSMSVSFMRLVRLLKLSKVLRLIRLLKFFTSLREIWLSLFYTLGSLLWSIVALTLTIYMFALLFMQWLNLQTQRGVEYSNYITDRFKSTWNAMMVLFSFISGGAEWYDLALEFDHHFDYVSKNALVLYIFFTLFGLVNVIVGVFVAKAAESSSNDEHLRIAKDTEKRVGKVKDLIQIFNEIDTERQGVIDQQQFHAYFEHSNTQYILQSHGLQLFDPDKLWEVISSYDAHLIGSVNLPGFVMGVMRLSGDAKSTELVLLSMRVEEIQATLRQNQHKIDELYCELSLERRTLVEGQKKSYTTI